jgi:CBS domain-containing protein
MTSRRLRTIEPAETMRATAALLSEGDIGLVVVCDERGTAVGVISKSDLVRHLARLGPVQSNAAALMTQPIISCRPEDELQAVWQDMTKRMLQSCPVLDGNSRPVGVLDIRDAMRALLDEERVEEESLISYISGAGYN